MESLRQKLFGGAKSLRDKLSESISGSYETRKLDSDTNIVTEKPNILERIGGKKEESYAIKMEERPEATPPIVPSYDTERKFETDKIIEPRKENILNKVRAKIEDVFDGEEQPASVVQATNEPELTKTDNESKQQEKESIDLPEIRDEHKEPIIKSAKEIGVDPTIIAKILRGEGLYSTEDQLKEAYKREGAIGPGQHRQIFYDEWNPKFKKRYGRDYDRKDLSDVATVASMAIKHYMDKYDSLDAALVAYNKGESVVQDYIDDPDVDLSEDPYVIGFKNR